MLGLTGCDPAWDEIDGDELLEHTVKIELYDYENTKPKLLKLNRRKKPVFDFDKATVDTHKEFCPPESVPERNYILDVEAQNDGYSVVKVESPNRKFGVYIKARKDTLPYFNEWKCVQPGVYTLAVEPSNNTLWGIVKEKEKGTMKTIAPYEKIEHKVIFGIYDL
jgi:hypothetical protein